MSNPMDNIEMLKKIIQKAPQEPGIYVYKDKNNAVIYVGKAIKLKSRLKSYVDQNILKQYPKTKKMISNAVSVEWYLTNTELEALVLEANLIKKYKPEYNISLKDDKAYKYIHISKSKDVSDIWKGSYKISTTRKKEGQGSYYGPFPSGTAVNTVLRDLRRIIPYRNCTETKFARYKKLQKPCLYGHIGICPAPCLGPRETQENNKNIDLIKRFLSGRYKSIIKDLKKEMSDFSKQQEYEKAAVIRDKLAYYEYLTQKYRSSQEILKNLDLNQGGYRELAILLSFLSMTYTEFNLSEKEDLEEYLKNFKIEFYDISNTASSIIVGSYITLTGGEFDKSKYRKFKIKTKDTQDDFAGMREIISRRLQHLEDWGKPDLVVIDGGKGQLSVVSDLLEDNRIPYIGIAKKQETIVIKNKKRYSMIDLPENDLGLNLLIRGRNEVHRFGITYNRSLRKIKQSKK